MVVTRYFVSVQDLKRIDVNISVTSTGPVKEKSFFSLGGKE
jgi:hypothetical protein